MHNLDVRENYSWIFEKPFQENLEIALNRDNLSAKVVIFWKTSA